MFSKLFLVVMVIFALLFSGAEAIRLRAKHQNSWGWLDRINPIRSVGEPCEDVHAFCESGSYCDGKVCVASPKFHS